MSRILGLAPHPDWRGGVIEELFRRPSLALMAKPCRREGVAA
jgi:hypothetical protein